MNKAYADRGVGHSWEPPQDELDHRNLSKPRSKLRDCLRIHETPGC
jgi:hypothetical protein